MPWGKWLERDIVIVACAISAGSHAALTPDHFGEGAGAGLSFLAASLALASLVVALTRSPGPPALLLTAATFTGLIVAYALAITSGVPLLHPEVEPVAGLALATKATETVGLVAAAHLLLRGRTRTFTRLERNLA